MHLNHLSQQCVTNDEVRGPRPRRGRKLHASHRFPVVQLYEEVRRTLEQCSVQKDIDHFVNLRRTGEKPAGRNSRLVPVLPTGVGQSGLVSRFSAGAL